MKQPGILIIDLSSQVASLIGRTLRDLNHRSAIFGPDGARKWLQKNKPKCIILSGGEHSVYDEEALMPPEEILGMGIPILGICFGMQWMAHKMGGKVVTNVQTDQLDNKNYGRSFVTFSSDNIVFRGVNNQKHSVWASHGDSVERVPLSFKESGHFSPAGTIAAMSNVEKGFYAVQYHPEVTHTSAPAGKSVLRNFVEDICGCEKDWSEEDLIESKKKEIAEVVAGDKAILPYSGGVDSSVTMALALSVLGNRLSAFGIDTGALRAGEQGEMISNAKEIGINLPIINDSKAYFNAIGDEIDAETKRKRFQSVYGPCLDNMGKKFGARFIFQGTNAADKIESGNKGKSSHIKSHHNEVETELIKFNPLQDLFKYEIRALAYKLGLSKAIAERKPFPGPGLFLRVNGIPATPDKIEIVRWADVVAMGILRKHKIYDKISQCPVNLNGVPTVGIKGDQRSYKYSIVIHPVVTMDFMTSTGYQINEYIRRELTREISKHPEVVRVLFDEGDKPPASTEWE